MLVTNTRDILRLQHLLFPRLVNIHPCAAQETACCNYLARSEPIMKGKQTVTYTINCSYNPQNYTGVSIKPINAVYITIESKDTDTDTPWQ